MISKLFADGGVIEKNPSRMGGTWAWIQVGEDDNQVACGYGVITPAEARMETVSNNLTELLALLYGLERLPVEFRGIVASDSQVSLGRLFMGWQWKNIPPWMHEKYQDARKRLPFWNDIQYVLLDGHPTRAQLAAGVGKRGHPVSRWNVLCDKLCSQAAELSSMA